MIYRFLADAVVILHLLFTLFVVLGGLLCIRWIKLIWIHLPVAVWGVVVEWAGWICPLTPFEILLREKGGTAGYGGGFVEHYLLPILYPSGLTRGIQLWLGIGVVVVNAAIYGYLIFRRVLSTSAAVDSG